MPEFRRKLLDTIKDASAICKTMNIIERLREWEYSLLRKRIPDIYQHIAKAYTSLLQTETTTCALSN